MAAALGLKCFRLRRSMRSARWLRLSSTRKAWSYIYISLAAVPEVFWGCLHLQRRAAREAGARTERPRARPVQTQDEPPHSMRQMQLPSHRLGRDASLSCAMGIVKIPPCPSPPH